MAKPPAFPFYPGDWLLGTLTFTLAEDGAYLRCLMHQWSTGAGIPGDDMAALARILRVKPAEARKMWAGISQKFLRSDDGLYRNARLEKLRAEKDAFHLSASKRGQKGAKGRWEKPNADALANGSSNGPSIALSMLNDGSSSSSSSLEQERARALEMVQPPPRKRHGDPHNFRVDANAAALIVISETQVVSIPESWAGRARREHALSFDDIDAFAKWCAGEAKREGFDDGGNKFRWLDQRLHAWKAKRKAAAVDAASRAAGDAWAEEQRRLDEVLAREKAEAKANGTYKSPSELLREGWNEAVALRQAAKAGAQ